MLKNYFKVAWRNILHNRISSFINISGLAVGMAVAMLTGLWLHDELSFNKYHENYHRIARVSISGRDEKGPSLSPTLSYPLVNELTAHYSDRFQRLVRASWVQESILSSGDRKISRAGQYMDAGAPDMFTLRMIRGSREGLRDLHSILISASTAKALFGDADPVGRVMLINNKTNVSITGVYEDLPLNTELTRIKYIAPFELWLTENDWVRQTAGEYWNHYLKLFAEIKQGATFPSVSHQIEHVEIDHIKNLDDENHRGELAQQPKIVLDPMEEWHLSGNGRGGKPDASVQQMVWLVSMIGAFVLLLACINFMNLSTARSEKRANEVGIRKAIGSMRGQLVLQFFCESLAMVTFSFLAAVALTAASLNWFNQLAAKQMSIPWSHPSFWIVSMAFILITGILAGSYPALFLSSFKPVRALKGTFRLGRGATIPRKVLVVFQFTISVALINCTIIVLRQVRHAKDRPVGYTREGLIMMQMRSGDFYGKYDLVRRELLNTGVVSEFAESMGKVTEMASNNGGFDWVGRDLKKEQNYGTLAVSPEYGKTIGWQFLQGRDFSRALAGDSMGMVINESAMKEMGLKDPVGTDVVWTWWQDRTQVLRYKIIGVVKDMIMESPYENTKPIVFYQKGHNGGVSWMIIKVKPGVAMHSALPKIEAVMKKLVPSAPFDYQFVDEDYALKFAAEDRISKLAGFFAALAIFISALGLFGLASFTAEQRTREVGIRKVLGASLLNIWSLLSKEFFQLVMVSLLIAMPVAYYFMHNWLQHYSYRTEISRWIFATSGFAALLITLITVSFQAMRAAMANPVESLRAE
ncbi:ABC transporter permease [Flavitalea sp. BT771]|uniref:ABC transporter permease n=1 Tax=Flavitalea sp. BT771 TaxID=3063329 RepID=UPI0026E31D62|nr:ABC transporter permease [Flavitalea sp. BT771]MDO6432936.1 ABC transporter permease [Flavitalea sp. BT771]MDV6221788.1 FtsX-like permease family protein [Flavitalea sp. BT771]